MTEAKKTWDIIFQSFRHPNQHEHSCEFGDITTISPNHNEASYGGNTLHLMRGDMSNMNMTN